MSAFGMPAPKKRKLVTPVMISDSGTTSATTPLSESKATAVPQMKPMKQEPIEPTSTASSMKEKSERSPSDSSPSAATALGSAALTTTAGPSGWKHAQLWAMDEDGYGEVHIQSKPEGIREIRYRLQDGLGKDVWVFEVSSPVELV